MIPFLFSLSVYLMVGMVLAHFDLRYRFERHVRAIHRLADATNRLIAAIEEARSVDVPCCVDCGCELEEDKVVRKDITDELRESLIKGDGECEVVELRCLDCGLKRMLDD